MLAKNRTAVDRFWPVFLGCLAIGVAEVLAVICVCFGKFDEAKRFDAYWLFGYWISSFWLAPHCEPRYLVFPRSWMDKPLFALSLGPRLVLAAAALAMTIVVASGVLFPDPWPTVLHSVTVGPYVLMVCRRAWRHDMTVESQIPGDDPHGLASHLAPVDKGGAPAGGLSKNIE
jgi:hypothetical protein